MKNKRYFPMFIDLSDKKIVVVGGGNIATRRIRTLLQFTRNITAIAPKSTMELQELGKTGYVNLITRPVKRSDFDMAYMVIAATNDWKLNDEILYGTRKGCDRCLECTKNICKKDFSCWEL